MRSPLLFALAIAALSLGLWLVPGTAEASHPHPLGIAPGGGAHVVSVAVHGDARCRDVVGHRCRGHLGHRPIEIVARRSGWVEIEVTRANVNTVIALVGPSGTHYDNDSGRGNLSYLRVYLSRGVHHLYVGPRQRRHVGTATVTITPERRHAPRVVLPPRPAPPRVVVVPTPPAPRVVVHEPAPRVDRRHHRPRRR